MGKLNRPKRAVGIIKKKYEQASIKFTYNMVLNPESDGDRMGKQFMRVWKLMSDAKWRTLREIEAETGDQQASISARLRDFRKKLYGGFAVGRRRRVGGLFEYQLVLEGKASD
jgi:hypothetical protein